jgi:predicted transposase YbfD/YdcC
VLRPPAGEEESADRDGIVNEGLYSYSPSSMLTERAPLPGSHTNRGSGLSVRAGRGCRERRSSSAGRAGCGSSRSLPGNKSGEPAIETHYYLRSLREDAGAMAARIRAHWSVEPERSGDSRRQISCHYVLDVTFGEDHSQVRERTAAHNLSILREHLPGKSIRSKRKLAAMDPAYRSELLISISHNFGAVPVEGNVRALACGGAADKAAACLNFSWGSPASGLSVKIMRASSPGCRG